ncbi:hypothetical protein ETAA8_40070 [Anatilimnocola aggregata]|uniref:Uncharacterized protein n=1 Tax=Anatilimnocola aggregata TaxID=2528021 RepID=A0A517YFB9_9BACT|nr:hypothetical protein ETAA8_40070 [Anatilimnocola aggregata]
MSSLPERVGRLINELDIDFSRFTVAGWLTSFTSLLLGLIVALAAYRSVVGKIRHDSGPALVFGLVMIGITVLSFLVMRAILAKLSIAIVRQPPVNDRPPSN